MLYGQWTRVNINCSPSTIKHSTVMRMPTLHLPDYNGNHEKVLLSESSGSTHYQNQNDLLSDSLEEISMNIKYSVIALKIFCILF